MIKGVIKELTDSFRKIGKREKVLVIALISLAAALLCYGIIYRPLAMSIRADKSRIEKTKARIADVRKGFPELSEREIRINELNAECDKLIDEIKSLESRLPSRAAASRLIGEITRLAKGVKLESIRRRIEKGAGYSRIFVELKIDASFIDAVRYVKRLENISPFIRVEEFEISQPRSKKSKKGVPARLVISSLLGETPFSEQLRAMEAEDALGDFRDIFVSGARPVSLKPKVHMRLDGITYDPGMPTGIINGEVVKEGSEIKNLLVKKIMPDMVILTDGVQDYTLSVER